MSVKVSFTITWSRNFTYMEKILHQKISVCINACVMSMNRNFQNKKNDLQISWLICQDDVIKNFMSYKIYFVDIHTRSILHTT